VRVKTHRNYHGLVQHSTSTTKSHKYLHLYFVELYYTEAIGERH